jgi:putative tricarboxylic transport membrane protein
MAPIEGTFRFTLGFHALDGGLNVLSVLIGVYAVTEVLRVAEFDVPMINSHTYKIKGFGFSLREFKSQTVNIIRSALIGIGIGVLPGIGQSVAGIVSYTTAKNQSKYPEKFGTGIIDGVVASETSNNAVCGGSMIPMLTLGIPGDGGTLILLSSLMIHGLQPGPLLFSKNPELVYTIFAFLVIAHFVMLGTEYFGMRAFLKIVLMPKYILMPLILVVCCVGAFSINNRLFDVWTAIFIGLLAYGMEKFNYPLAPFMLGFVLGGMFEENLRRALMFTKGRIFDFFKYPIAVATFIIFIIVLAYFVKSYIWLRKKPENHRDRRINRRK